mmetsp:Transcript_94639/g.149685  ORF Transcript_94639/g.149685 Transcript_94639/m.149685 type:complete len:100 (-) Transcript_94639:1187-1486(-)
MRSSESADRAQKKTTTSASCRARMPTLARDWESVQANSKQMAGTEDNTAEYPMNCEDSEPRRIWEIWSNSIYPICVSQSTSSPSKRERSQVDHVTRQGN